MEIETLYSGTRWEIISALSKDALSPMELADKINTTSANVSQQLRLLELGGLVKSERTSNVEKGKPRILYSLSEDSAYIILTSPHFSDKQQLSLDNYHNFMVRSWFLGNKDYHRHLGEIYFKIHDHLDKIKVVAAKEGRGLAVSIVVKDSKDKDKVKKAVSDLKKASFDITDKDDIQDDFLILYDNREVKV